MDTNYLQELIDEAYRRGGGMILNFENKPAAVVLSIEKYNEMISGSVNQRISESADQLASESASASQELFSEPKKLKILVTGGAGYIGAHTARMLLGEGYEVVVFDNLSCGKRENVPLGAKFVEGDLADTNLLKDLFAMENFDSVMHFAASIEVKESFEIPEKYLKNNTFNTANLISVMLEAGVKKIIFSSTAAVYGLQEEMPIAENSPLRPNNPYGYSKLLAEKVIKYHCKYSGLQAVIFRYFNACGFGFGGEILPTHNSHLISKVLEVAKGEKPFLTVNGNTYETLDGTCVRDYVHVLDIATAHVLGLKNLENQSDFEIFNIGTGKGVSVLEMVSIASEVLEKIIPMEIGPCREGDAPITVADNTKILKILGFSTRYSNLENIIRTTWQ